MQPWASGRRQAVYRTPRPKTDYKSPCPPKTMVVRIRKPPSRVRSEVRISRLSLRPSAGRLNNWMARGTSSPRTITPPINRIPAVPCRSGSAEFPSQSRKSGQEQQLEDHGNQIRLAQLSPAGAQPDLLEGQPRATAAIPVAAPEAANSAPSRGVPVEIGRWVVDSRTPVYAVRKNPNRPPITA